MLEPKNVKNRKSRKRFCKKKIEMNDNTVIFLLRNIINNILDEETFWTD